MADGTLFGLVRDINQRRQAARVRDTLRQNDFFNNPMGAITALNEAGFMDQALGLRDQEVARQAALAENQRKIGAADNERYRTALQGVTRALTSARDNPALDLGSEYDRLAPSFTRGFGMKPEEVVQLREQIVGNPQILDQFSEMFADPNKQRFGVIPGGGQVYNQNTGELGGRNPGTVKPVQLKRGDGGTDLYIIDEEGNLVNSGVSTPGGTAGPIPSGTGGGGYSGPLGINPQARGVRNNNMGNIKDGPWAKKQPGYAGSDGTFAKFNTPEAGSAAQETLLRNHYVNGQRTVNDIVNKYLGGPNNSENSAASQANYKAYVAGRLGIPANQPVPAEMTGQLAQAMREFENGTGRPAAARAGGPVASSAGKPAVPQGWRELTPAEKAQRGLPADKAFQIGISGASTGKIEPVGGQGTGGVTGKAGKPAGVTMEAHQQALTGLTRLRDQARRIINSPAFGQATGAIQGRLPSLFQGSVSFDKDLQSYKDATVLNALRAMKAASPNGASGFGSLQLKEGERLENSTGSLDQTDPEGLRRTLNSNANDAMISIGMLFNIPPDATQMLINNPALAPAFDVKYGKGLARRIIGGK